MIVTIQHYIVKHYWLGVVKYAGFRYLQILYTPPTRQRLYKSYRLNNWPQNRRGKKEGASQINSQATYAEISIREVPHASANMMDDSSFEGVTILLLYNHAHTRASFPPVRTCY